MHPAHDRTPLDRFFDSGVGRHSLALVYGRRRIGKSTLLASLARERGGFYWEATRAEPAIHLRRLGQALGQRLGVGPLALADWEDAISRLLAVTDRAGVPVVLDEFGYLLEAEPGLDSIIASALGPGARHATGGGARLVLCGSAVAIMRRLTDGHAPLRGRAALELVLQPFDYRRAATMLGATPDLDLAQRLYAVIGGVIGYATDMVDDDLPRDAADFARWVADRVLSPAATLHYEASTLLAEDPSLATSSRSLHHSILGVIANGAVTAGTIANALRRPVSNLDPALKRLIAAGFVVRHEDPIRTRRPTYALADPFLQFHYAVLEPHGALLRDREPRRAWDERLATVFDARVRGPVVEEQARTWVRRFATLDVLGGEPDHVGPSSVVIDGVEHELDVLVAADDDGAEPARRTVRAIGEAKAGETVGAARLRHLEAARAALGTQATDARLLLVAPAFTDELQRVAESRPDVVLVDRARLYH
jgi:AAA+ ATPase superfamily predicted ATPase